MAKAKTHMQAWIQLIAKLAFGLYSGDDRTACKNQNFQHNPLSH